MWCLDNNDYSFHEMGYYDNHALIGYIYGQTGAKVVYVGYSLGASNGLVYASNRSDEASKTTRLMIVMAPASHIRRGTSAAKYTVAPFLYLQNKLNFLDLRSTILRHDIWYLRVLRSTFALFPCKKCIVYLTSIFSGWTPDVMDPVSRHSNKFKLTTVSRI